MSIKIQINSLQALERLIGGDTELEIEVRRSVLKAFTTKHLQPLLKSEAIKSAQELIKDEQKAVTKEIFEDPNSYWPALSQTAEQLIESKVVQLINKTVLTHTNEEATKLQAVLTSTTDALSDRVFKAITDAAFEQQVIAAVNERLLRASNG